ncbi:U6 snRNA phosphodiesterase 1-like isoform X4 [Acropora muricata]|uniref:U6 snRNA phosphodiesterase-like isoform X4 n=1 Tax=Acropora millepora TaxID=45264 RepID=UPI001CF50A78|nr:U6 snRNA phosphodiesterase-like isoform X4 [Acropora millepora]
MLSSYLVLSDLAKQSMATDGLSMLSFAYGSDESESSSTEDEGAERKHHTSNSQSMAKKRKIGEDERSVKIVKPSVVLQFPEEIATMFEESRLHHKDTECVEDQSIFNGPIRTFPHFPGNWAMHVFIPFMATVQFEDLVTSLVASLSPVISSDVHKLSPTGLHISLSRTVAIRHYWIDTLVQQLRYMLQRVRRSFIALKTSGECQKDPSFHVSVAWFLGECCANEILVNLQSAYEAFVCKEDMTTSLVVKVEEVHCKIGNKLFVFALDEGKRHDAGMLRMSGLMDQLQQFSHSPAGQPLCIYGDPAYPLRIHLQAPYKAAHLTQDQEAFNSSMSDVRSAVEWVFGDILSYFAFLDFKKNLKIGLSPIGTMYSVCGLLRNAITCFYSSITSDYFDLQPPTIQEYFQI